MEGRSRDRPMRRNTVRHPSGHNPSMEGRSRDRPMVGFDGEREARRVAFNGGAVT